VVLEIDDPARLETELEKTPAWFARLFVGRPTCVVATQQGIVTLTRP